MGKGMSLEQLVVFGILVQDIEGSAPLYIEEKFHQVRKHKHPEALLDSGKRKIFDTWQKRWKGGA